MSNNQPPAPKLTVSIDLNVNTGISGDSEAQTVFYALIEYRDNCIRRLVHHAVKAAKDDNDYTDAVDEWELLKVIDGTLIRLTDKLIDLSETNYWAYTYSKGRSDYDHIKHNHEERRQSVQSEFLKAFDIEGGQSE